MAHFGADPGQVKKRIANSIEPLELERANEVGRTFAAHVTKSGALAWPQQTQDEGAQAKSLDHQIDLRAVRDCRR